jgi:hypothetical protein
MKCMPSGPHDGLAPLLHSLAGNAICKDGKMEGLNALCEMLKVNTTLHSIKCASETIPHVCECFTPLGPVNATLSLLLSLSKNQLCGVNQVGYGTYTAEGITQVAEALKVNKTLQSIEYAAEPNPSTNQPSMNHLCVRAR